MFSAERSSISAQNWGAQPTMEKPLRNERKTYPKGSRAPPAYEILAAPRPARTAGKLFKIQRRQKLFGIGQKTQCAGGKGGFPRGGHLSLRHTVNKPDNPEVLAVPFPSAPERRRITRSKGRTPCSE